MNSKQNIKLIELIDQQTGRKQPYILQLNQLGKGFYGTVFKAIHKYNPSLIFAVKVIKLQNKQTKDQILKQLQIIQKIPRSPNLVDTHKQHLQSEKHLYIFQQYCQGGSLSDFRQRNSGRLLRECQIYDMFFQLAKGYIDLYNAGIIHEDIKPSNILIKGRLYKYCDFGVSELAANVKHTNSRKGTVSYMPPQKLKSKFLPNPKSDIYSLGVTIYEVVFGFHPYLQKKTKNIKEYLTALGMARLRPIHQIQARVYNPSVAFNKFYQILQRMISLKPDIRIGIQQLKDITQNHQIFKEMRIPVQNQSPLLKRNKLPSKNFDRQPTSQQENITIAHSMIIIRKGQGQNRLLNQQFQIQLAQSQKQKEQTQKQTLRLTKLKQQQQQKMLFNLSTQHKIIQTVIAYLNQGYIIIKYVFENVQKSPYCNNTFFNDIENCKDVKMLEILGLVIMKFNVVLMKNFVQSVQNFQKFYQENILYDQVEFLEAQYTKFLAKITIENQQSRKSVLNLIRNSSAADYIKILQKQFIQIYKCLVQRNSIRINFKKDLLSGIFLIHVNKVLKALYKFDFLVQQGSSNISQILQSQQMQVLDRIIKTFNIYRTLKLQDLKKQFYKQFQHVEDIIYDGEEDTGEFIDISDLLVELQDEQNGGYQEQKDIQGKKKAFDELQGL